MSKSNNSHEKSDINEKVDFFSKWTKNPRGTGYQMGSIACLSVCT